MDLLNQTSTNSTSGPSVSWGSRALVPSVLLFLCFLVGFPGNLAVIILKPNWQKMSRLTQCLMINLALSDLLCLVTLPVWIYTLLYSWTLGVVACKCLSFLVYCSIYSSLLTVTALSIQRYMQVVHQQRCLQFKKRLLVLLWIIAMTISIPALVLRQPIKIEDGIICLPKYTSSAQHVAVLLTECCVGVGSFAVIAFAYICVKKKINQAIFFNNAKTSKLVTSIIVAFCVLWMPYHVLNLVGSVAILQDNQGVFRFYDESSNIVGSVTFINSCLNPLLYAFTSRNTCPCVVGKQQSSSNNEQPSSTTGAFE